MRTLTDHVVSGDQAVQLEIEVLDEPGQGGASHFYRVGGFDVTNNASYVHCNREEPSNYDGPEDASWIIFQNGPIKEFGVNGITQEVLLAIVIDRLRGFQAGPYAHANNGNALFHCENALEWLQKRTLERIARGVEGTNQK